MPLTQRNPVLQLVPPEAHVAPQRASDCWPDWDEESDPDTRAFAARNTPPVVIGEMLRIIGVVAVGILTVELALTLLRAP